VTSCWEGKRMTIIAEAGKRRSTRISGSAENRGKRNEKRFLNPAADERGRKLRQRRRCRPSRSGKKGVALKNVTTQTEVFPVAYLGRRENKKGSKPKNHQGHTQRALLLEGGALRRRGGVEGVQGVNVCTLLGR